MHQLSTTIKRREKLFGEGRPLPLDRNAKARIMVYARALSRRTDKGKHYGVLTAKFIAVLDALVWGFHNAATGSCFPAYETIAERAGCARSTVYEAIRALELAGLLTWVNRIRRVREWGEDLFGRAQNRWRVVRTSNAYTFNDPQKIARGAQSFSSKSDLPTGTAGQVLKLEGGAGSIALDPANRLHRALMRLERGIVDLRPPSK